MKSRGNARRHYRGHKKRGARRQTPLTPATAVPSAPSPRPAPPPPPPPVAGIPHRQVLADIKKIGIIGGAILVLLLVLSLVWR